ncbi:hypothetical protein V1511DRAFT_513353 [Dipodascopsis uninucleata]
MSDEALAQLSDSCALAVSDKMSASKDHNDCIQRANDEHKKRRRTRAPSQKTIKRRRQMTVCLSCAAHRVKCDKVKPRCGRCQNLNRLCQYPESNHKASHLLGDDQDIDIRDDESKYMIDMGCESSRYSGSMDWVASLKRDAVTANLILSYNREHGESLARIQQELKILCGIYMPSRSKSDYLVRTYFLAVHPFVPILEEKKMLEEYEELWNSINSPHGMIDQAVCIFFAICYASSVALEEEMKYDHTKTLRTERNDYHRDVQNFRMALQRSFDIFQYPRSPYIRCFTASLILQTVVARNSDIDGTAQVSLSMRIAEVLGLHRDPKVFKAAKLTDDQIEARRRLWWMVGLLDMMTSISNGLQMSAHYAQFQVEPPTWKYSSETNRALYLICRRRQINGEFLRKELRSFYGQRLPERDKEILKCIQHLREDTMRDIEELQQLNFDDVTDPFTRNYQNNLREFGLNLVRLQLEKYTLFLYDSQEIDRNDSAKVFEHRVQTLNCAMKTIKLHSTTCELPRFSIFTWGTRIFNQFHAIVHVLRDIYRFPFDPVSLPDERVPLVQEGILYAQRLNLGQLSLRAEWQMQAINKIARNVCISVSAQKMQNNKSISGSLGEYEDQGVDAAFKKCERVSLSLPEAPTVAEYISVSDSSSLEIPTAVDNTSCIFSSLLTDQSPNSFELLFQHLLGSEYCDYALSSYDLKE